MIKTIEQIKKMLAEEKERHNGEVQSILAEIRETLCNSYGVRHQFGGEVELDMEDEWVKSIIDPINENLQRRKSDVIRQVDRITCKSIHPSHDFKSFMCLLKVTSEDPEYLEYPDSVGRHHSLKDYVAYLERQKEKNDEVC